MGLKCLQVSGADNGEEEPDVEQEEEEGKTRLCTSLTASSLDDIK